MRFLVINLLKYFLFFWAVFLQSSLVSASTLAERSDDTAVILVHGWGHSPRVPRSTWARVLIPYTDLTKLSGNYSEIGFKNILMSDDVSMKALQGSFFEKSKAILNAGCDIVLHCNGKMDEMLEINSALPFASDEFLGRFIK